MQRLTHIAVLFLLPALMLAGQAFAITTAETGAPISELWLSLGIASIGVVGLIAMRHHIQRL